jgi:hypothetical protein
MVFYRDCSLIDECAGFAYHRTGEGGFDFEVRVVLSFDFMILNTAGLFTAKLTVLYVTMGHIGDVIDLRKNA